MDLKEAKKIAISALEKAITEGKIDKKGGLETIYTIKRLKDQGGKAWRRSYIFQTRIRT